MFESPLTTPSNTVNGHWTHETFLDKPVFLDRGSLLESHLHIIHRTLETALRYSPRSYVVRFDLRLPACLDENDTAVITRFVRALRLLLQKADDEKIRQGKRVHQHNLRFCWVREWGKEGRPHYHFALMLNHDRYRTLGSFEEVEGNLSARIKQAWATATHQTFQDASRLVHFAKKGEYWLNQNAPTYDDDYASLFKRLSYMAKVDTKRFGIAQHSIGTSRNL